MGVEPTTTILETVALPLSYGSTWRSFYAIFDVFSTFDGPLVVDYRQANETERGCSSTAIERPNASSGDAGSRPAFRFLSHSTFCPSIKTSSPPRQWRRETAS